MIDDTKPVFLSKSPLTISGWIALEVVVEEKVVKKMIPELKRAGAEGIIEYPLNKLIA